MVIGNGTVIQPNCDVQQEKASFTISDLSPFRALITFVYGLGFGSTTLPSPTNGDDYSEYTIVFFVTIICCIFISTDTSTLMDSSK